MFVLHFFTTSLTILCFLFNLGIHFGGRKQRHCPVEKIFKPNFRFYFYAFIFWWERNKGIVIPKEVETIDSLVIEIEFLIK